MRLRTKSSRFFALTSMNVVLLTSVVVSVELLFGNWFAAFTPPEAAVVGRALTYRQRLYEPASDVHYVRDRFGLRGVREPIADVALVTVGGSTTDQRYVSDGETWQDVLRARAGIRVANAGVDGMTSRGHVAAVAEWLHRIPGLAPTSYVHLIGANDASLTETTPPESSRTSSAWYLELMQKSALAKGALLLWPPARWPRVVSHGALTVAPGAASQPTMNIALAGADIDRFIANVYQPALLDLIALHRGRGERVILASQPANPGIVDWRNGATFVAPAFPDVGPWAVALGRINAATERACRNQPGHCRFIDLARAQFAASDFYDLVHTTPAGSRQIGEILARELAAGEAR